MITKISSDELVEYGVQSATDIFFGGFQGEALNAPIVDLDQLLQMLDMDGQALSLYRVITSPLISTPIQIISRNKRSQREAEFVRKNLLEPPHKGGMETPIHYVLSAIARVIIEGYSPHELVWKIDESENKALLKKIAYRPARTCNVLVDDTGMYNGFVQRTNFLGRSITATIEKDKSLWFLANPEFNHLYGKSMFNAAYYHYEKKHKLYYIAHIAAQLKATGAKIIIPPENITEETDRKKVMDAVAKLGFNSTVYLPFGWDLKLLDLGVLADMLPLIHHHDLMMSKSVLAQFLDLGVASDTGSFALAESHSNAFIEQILKVRVNIANVFNNNLIPKMVDYNYTSKNYPTFQYAPLSRVNIQMLRDYFVRIATSRFQNTSPEFYEELEKRVSDAMGFEIDFDGINYPDLRTRNEPKASPDRINKPNTPSDDNPKEGEDDK